MSLMWLVPIVSDLGNLIFILSGLPQMIKSYRNREDGLRELSILRLIGYSMACIFFFILGVLTGAPITIFGNIYNEILFISQAYWKWKYGRIHITPIICPECHSSDTRLRRDGKRICFNCAYVYGEQNEKKA